MALRAARQPTLRTQGAKTALITRPQHGLRLRVRAQQQQRPDDSGSRAGAAGPKPLALPTSIDRMLTRYDFLSTGCGALAVTGYCVMRGQDAGTAALITLTATVVALVANELLFTDSQQ